MLKAIRPFVNFNYDLTKPLAPASKGKIRRYFEHLEALSARDNQIYRARKKSNLRRVQEAAQNEMGAFPDFKVAFVPKNKNVGRIKIKIRKNDVVFEGEKTSRNFIPLDPQSLATDPIPTVAKAVRRHDSYDFFRVAAGMYEIPTGWARDAAEDLMAEDIARLINRYSPNPNNPGFLNTTKDGKPAHVEDHLWSQWLTGIIGYKGKMPSQE